MLPGIRPGQLIVVVSKRPKVGDIVLVTIDGREVVKRIAQLDQGRVYLLGDNQAASTDSRSYGFVSARSVRGVVIWPRN